MERKVRLISLGLLAVALAFAQNNSVYPSQITLGAGQPAGVTSVTAQNVGSSGQVEYYYWVIANWPIGQTNAAQAWIGNAPNTLTSGHYVRVSWNLIGAVSYDVLRTTTPNLPNTCTCAVATGNTSGIVLDQGGALSTYTYAPAGNAQATITLDNKDYPTPTVLVVPPLTTGSNIALTSLAAQAADTIVSNATAGNAAPTAVVMPTCTTGADLYNTSTHSWSCVSTGDGAPAPGILNHVYVSDSLGGWLDTGCTWSPSTYAISCPTTVPLVTAGTCVASSSVTPPLNGVAEFCDSGNANHLSVKLYGGSVVDLQSGGVGGSGWPTASTPSISPVTGSYSSTQTTTVSCAVGLPYYCVGTLGSACVSNATVTAYSVGVSVATSERFQAQCRDLAYDPGPVGYSDIIISGSSNLLTSPTNITNAAWVTTDSTKTSALVWTSGSSGNPSLNQAVTTVVSTSYTATATVQITASGAGTVNLIITDSGGGVLASIAQWCAYGSGSYTFSVPFNSGLYIPVHYVISTSYPNLQIALSGLSLQ